MRDATDPLYDTSPAAMAARFGRRAIALLRDGRDASAVARLAASFAFQAEPSLRLEGDGTTGVVIDARTAFGPATIAGSDRTGTCSVCGWLVQQHFDAANRSIGCEGARRINEEFLQKA